jgi:DNA polymerase III subunit chi
VGEGGCEVWFYHLERTALDHALPDLLEKTLAKGWRAIVRTTTSERLARLDSWLWTFRDDSFLAHGLADEPDAARQPILLTTAEDNLNRADALFLVEGAEERRFEGYKRCIDLFDGRDEQAVAAARARWKLARSLGLPVTYWKQGERGWEKQG